MPYRPVLALAACAIALSPHAAARKGRVFHSTLGHLVESWDDPVQQQMYDSALQLSMGLVLGDAGPLQKETRPLTEEESTALPPGDGREAVSTMCVPCHGVLPAIALRKTPLAWRAIVDDMRVKGAKGTDAEADAAVTYLSEHFTAVDVNTASAEDLARVAGFTAEEAAAIVAYRQPGRAFKSYTDVKRVPGLDAKRLADAKPKLAYAPK